MYCYFFSILFNLLVRITTLTWTLVIRIIKLRDKNHTTQNTRFLCFIKKEGMTKATDDEYLKSVYYNLKRPERFGGVESLYRDVKQISVQLTAPLAFLQTTAGKMDRRC